MGGFVVQVLGHVVGLILGSAIVGGGHHKAAHEVLPPPPPAAVQQSIIIPTFLSPGDGTPCGGFIPQGGVRLAALNCVVSGDVSTGPTENGPWHFEKNGDGQKRGTMIVVHNTPTWIHADYPASITDTPADEVEQAMKASGCIGGCLVVDKIER